MKTVSSTLQAHIEGELTTLAACWKLSLQNGTDYFFTDHDVDLIIDGDTYEAASGMLPMALDQNGQLSPDNMDVIAFLESAKISEVDILAGDLDYAIVDIFVVNYNNVNPIGGSLTTGQFGNAAIGSSPGSLEDNITRGHFDYDQIESLWGANVLACTVTKMWVYARRQLGYPTPTVRMAVYDADDSDNELWTVEKESPGFPIDDEDVWKWYSVDCDLDLVAGNKALAIISYNGGTFNVIIDSTVKTGTFSGDTVTFNASTTAFDDPLGVNIGGLKNWSIYAEYEYTSPLTEKLWLAKDWILGKIEIRDQTFQAEIRGKAQYLDQQLCERTTPECRAVLGDTRCGVDMDDSGGTHRYDAGAVTSQSDDRRTFIDTSAPNSEDFFSGGLLTWIAPDSGDSFNGDNAGYQMEVKSYDISTKEFVLFQPMPLDIQVGDEFTVKYGCNKGTTHCKDRFSNLVNFRGEPFIPGWDAALHTGKA